MAGSNDQDDSSPGTGYQPASANNYVIGNDNAVLDEYRRQYGQGYGAQFGSVYQAQPLEKGSNDWNDDYFAATGLPISVTLGNNGLYYAFDKQNNSWIVASEYGATGFSPTTVAGGTVEQISQNIRNDPGEVEGATFNTRRAELKKNASKLKTYTFF